MRISFQTASGGLFNVAPGGWLDRVARALGANSEDRVDLGSEAVSSNPWPELARAGKVTAFQPVDPSPMVGGPAGVALGQVVREELCGVVSRLESKGFSFEARMTDGSFRKNLRQGPEESWRFDAQLPGEKGFVVLTELDDLRVLDGVSGLGADVLSSSEQAQLRALEGLWQAGYAQHCQQYHDKIHPASVLNTLRDGHPVYLYPPGAANPNECKSPDHLLALAFLEGKGSSEALEHPELALRLQRAQQKGITLHDERGYKITAHTAYRSSQADDSPLMASSATVPVAIKAADLADPEALVSHLESFDQAYRRYSEPVLERLHLDFRDDYFGQIGVAEDPFPLDVRLATATALIERYKEVIPDQGIFTNEVLPLYQALRKRAKSPAELVRMTERMLPKIGNQKREVLLATAQSSPTLGVLPRTDPVQSEQFPRLLERTGSLSRSLDCLKAMGAADAQTDERFSVMLELIDSLPENCRDQAASHFQVIEGTELGTLSLREKAALYKSMLTQLGADSAGEAQALFQVAAERGQGDPEAVQSAISELVSQMLLSAAFEVSPDAAPSGVHEESGRVVVGPVSVRKRPSLSAA